MKKNYKKISKQLNEFYCKDSIDIVVNQWIPAKICLGSIGQTKVKLITCNHGQIKYIPPFLKTLKQKLFYRIFGSKAGFLRVYWHFKPLVLNSVPYVCLCDSYVKDIKSLYNLKNDRRIIAVPNPCTYNVVNEYSLQKKKKEVILLEEL